MLRSFTPTAYAHTFSIVVAYRNVLECDANYDTEYRIFDGGGPVACQQISEPPVDGVACDKFTNGGANGPLDCDSEALCQGISCDPPLQYRSAYVNGTTQISGAAIDFECLLWDTHDCSGPANYYQLFDHSCGSVDNSVLGSFVAFSCVSDSLQIERWAT